MKPSPEQYAKLPTRDKMTAINIPGIYCKGCGQTFALYSYSVFQADGFDENNKAYYNKCLLCQDEKEKTESLKKANPSEGNDGKGQAGEKAVAS